MIFIYFLSLTSGCSQNLTIQENCAINQCTIVVDAGSTGSKLHVYSSSSLSSPQINELYVKRIQPGIASLSRTQSDMNEYLSQLFQGLDVKNICCFGIKRYIKKIITIIAINFIFINLHIINEKNNIHNNHTIYFFVIFVIV